MVGAVKTRANSGISYFGAIIAAYKTKKSFNPPETYLFSNKASGFINNLEIRAIDIIIIYYIFK